MFKKILFTFSLVILALSIHAQTIYFVDQTGSSDNDGILYDQGGEEFNYPPDANDAFTITPNDGKEVKIQFRDFDIEPGATNDFPETFRLCEYDNVTIFDGPDTNSTNLGVFCGSSLPPDFESTTGSITIQLKSDGGTEKRGFDIYWTTGTLPPPPISSLYCEAAGNNCIENDESTYGRYISNVALTNLNNSSICSPSGYSDYSKQIAVIPTNTQAQLKITTVFSNPTLFVFGWIDYNNDLVFTTDEAIGISGNGLANTHTAVITALPGVSGKRRMRLRYDVAEANGVATVTGGNNGPCGTSEVGEVEDYTVFFGDTVIVGAEPSYCAASGPSDCINQIVSGTDTIFQEDYIDRVTLSNDGVEIVNNTMCDGGYGDFTNIVASISAGGNYSILFSRNNGNDIGAAAGWIDWNNNKIFEESEYYPAVNNITTQEYTINYAVDPTQIDGSYRVRLRLGGNVAPTNACGTGTYEVEDYTLFVGTPLSCITNPMPSDAASDICVSNGTLIWDSVPEATNYRFSLSYNAGAGDVIVAQEIALSDTTFTSALVPNATYKWIAVPYNENSEALSCDTLMFSTTTNGNPVVDIVEENIQICAGNTYSITANVTEGNAPISFVWTDANAQLDRTDSSVVVFEDNTPGIYKFFVSVSDDKSCSGNTDSVTVEVSSGAVQGDFTIADTNACFNEAVVIDWINQFGADTIQVSTDNVVFTDADDVVENGSEFSVFLDPGVYFLRGRLDAGSGCTDVTASIEVVVNTEMAKPVVDYVASNEACQGNEVFVEVTNYSNNITWNNDPTLTSNPLGVTKSSDNVATVTDPITGCSIDSEPISVIINGAPPKPVLVCDGNSLVSDGVVTTYEWYKNEILLPQFEGQSIEYDKDGSFYNAIAVSDKGCKSVLSDTVFMLSKANILYDNVNLTADVVGSYYKWYLDGAEITGETAQTLAHNKVEGKYTVEALNDNDCASTISDEFVLSTVGVETHFTSENVSVYPNPSNGSINVFVANSFKEIVSISINDLSGKSVFLNEIEANQINFTLRVSDLDAGMYIVNVASVNQSIQIKLIVR